MFLRRFLAGQLARPSGLAGWFMGRALDNINVRVNELALADLRLQPGDHLLDVGFGGGLMIRQALSRAPGGFVAGIDISQPMLRRGSRIFRNEIQEGRVEIREAGAASIPYAEDR